MSFEMAEADKYIGVHDGTADLRLFHQFPALYRDADIIGSLQAIADNNMAARRQKTEPVLIGRAQMLQRVFPSSHIQGVAVCEEGAAAQFLNHIRHRFGVIRTQERKIPRLAEMDLDRGHLFLKIDLPDPCFPDQLLKLLRKIRPRKGTHVCEINF